MRVLQKRVSKAFYGAISSFPDATSRCGTELHISIWCASECWNFYLFDVVTKQLMTDGNEQPVLALGWRAGVRIKNASDIIKRVMVHTARICTNMLFKWQQRAGLSPPRRGTRKKKTATWKRKQTSVQCAAKRSLDCKLFTLHFIQFLDLSQTMSDCETKQGAANHTILLLLRVMFLQKSLMDDTSCFLLLRPLSLHWWNLLENISTRHISHSEDMLLWHVYFFRTAITTKQGWQGEAEGSGRVP